MEYKLLSMTEDEIAMAKQAQAEYRSAVSEIRTRAIAQKMAAGMSMDRAIEAVNDEFIRQLRSRL
jgi:hypothetical protein